MPTIGQLPVLSTVDPADEIPVSHGGTTQSISVGTLLSGVQPAILAPTGTLLGRESLGAGGPEPISVGSGLDLKSGTLTATGGDHASFATTSALDLSDQAVVSSDGSPKLLELTLLRGLFSAGTNIAIDTSGTISATVPQANADSTLFRISDLPVVTAISADDLIGVSQGGTADCITYQNFLNGLTIDNALAAVAASDSDTFWVAQGVSTMARQTFSAIWAWIVSNQPRYSFPVVELTVNTILDSAVHNGRILVCSKSLTLTPVFANMGSGFTCSVINLSGANVDFDVGIVSSSGISILPAGLSCTMQGLAYSGGNIIYAAIAGNEPPSTLTLPGAVIDVGVTSVSSGGVSLIWLSPTTGGAVTSYTVEYQIIGATEWTTVNSSIIDTAYTVSGLLPSTTYNFVVFATNSAGTGPSSTVISGVTAATGGIAPGQVTEVSVSAATSSALSLMWSAPSAGTTPFSYTIDCRQTGTVPWTTYASSVSITSASVTGLSPATLYDLQIYASNAWGAGLPSVIISQNTVAAGTAVTALTWNLVPSGSYSVGGGSIGVNAHVTPSSAAVQFGFSASSTIPPAIWTQASYVNSDLWGAYISTPATAGTWYSWAEGIDGSLPTVYSTPFTVS